ncbi:pilus assembly protein [Fictibacillus phosphorivorans]|uniref:pilus assembly protein n=1 Tax=Fictibacillus phosphorivorans TaxID=1221500 RepID=UPI002041D177|nr:pilus assembly protein [Fictibacillus phosphorivorans]MCM3719805.1 pilus assembly protein [Fictibacillus phosphorivorans]MCM3777524.1 pilus assembly protein [Fictibacillus phosphorivorans]
MKKYFFSIKRKINNEKGAISLEFLGILPFYFFLLLLLWQAVAFGYSVITTQSAMNEAAKVVSTGGTQEDAINQASEIIGGGDLINFQSVNFSPIDTDGDFTTTINVEMGLVFIPDQWRSKGFFWIPFELSTNSRVISYE